MAQTLSGPSAGSTAAFRLQPVCEVVAKIEPGDRHREHDPDQDGSDERHYRQSRIEGDGGAEG